MKRTTDTEAKRPTERDTEADRNRRMAIATARADRAESAAYHLAASCGRDENGRLIYPADGSAWTALGLARLASLGLSVAVKSYRTARLTSEAWADLHGALVVAALAKGTEADGNVNLGRRFVPARVNREAATVQAHRGRQVPAEALPTVGQVNATWAIERAKGMLADYWAGEAVPTAWDTESGDDRPDDTEAADTWGEALTWADLAPALGATAPAERMAIDLALTADLQRAEAGAKAATYGAKAPMGAEAAKKAVQRATKALAARHTEATVREAVRTALGEAQDTEALTAVATLAPATMRNAKVPAWEARLDLARLASPRGLRSAFLARHYWPRQATAPAPGGRQAQAVNLAPIVATEDGRRVLILAPVAATLAPIYREAAEARQARREAEAKARAERPADHLLGRIDGLLAQAEHAEAVAADLGTALASIRRAGEARLTAAKARAKALALGTCTLAAKAQAPAPRWTAADRAAYLAGLPASLHLAHTEAPQVPAEHTEAEARAIVAKAQAKARTWDTEHTETAPQGEAYPAPGQDVAPWRMAGPCGPVQARPLTAAEAKAQAEAKAKAKAERATWADTERAAWEAKAVAQVNRAKRAAERAKRAA
jgi:hypothetical protein